MHKNLCSLCGFTARLTGAILFATELNRASEAVENQHPAKHERMTHVEKQLTHARGGHILTNMGVWSPGSEWIVYDTRSDPAGDNFDGSRVEMVNIHTGEV